MPYLAAPIFASPASAAPAAETIAVDERWRILADPDAVAALTVEQLGRLLIHLAGHLIRDHAGRARHLQVVEDGARARWNRCADAEINDDLIASDCVPDVAPDQPHDLGCDPGGLAERYYADAHDGPRHWDCGSGADGCRRPWDGESGGGIGATQAELLRVGTAAEIRRHEAREPGTVPAGWLRFAESVLPSRIDWRRVLAAEIRSAVAAVAGKVDYAYRRPSRRAHVHGDVVLPTLIQPLPDVAIVCDTSGSMHDRLLERALAEVEGVLTRAGLRRAQVRVLAVDTEVHETRRVSRVSQVRLAGGGGTDMGRGIDAAAALRPRPSVVIVLTDGYTPWPERPPAGVRVVIGLLTEGHGHRAWPSPDWARAVEIAEVAGVAR